MTAQIRSKALALAAVLAATTLAACGGDDSSDSGAKSGNSGDSRAAADKIIEQAVAANDKASSASIDATIDVTIKGVPRFKEPVQVTANGDYNLPEGADVPDFNVDVGLGLNGGTIGGGLVLADGKGFITLGDTGYPLPAKISEKIAEPAPDAKNGLTKTAAMFYINPQDWQKNAQLVGDARVAGEETDHIKADIQPDKFFDDIARLVNVLTALRVTQAVALPEHLSARRARGARALHDAGQGRGLDRQGRPRAAQGHAAGRDQGRQEGPGGARRRDRRDARGDGQRHRGRHRAQDQRAEAARLLQRAAAQPRRARRVRAP